MRRYFYLLMLLFSMSLFSQDVNNEIIGKWKVTGMYHPTICVYQVEFPKIYIVFNESDLGYYIYPKIKGKAQESNKFRWRINDEGLIEFKSNKNEIVIEQEFKFIKGNRYFLYHKGWKTFIEKIKT